MLGFLAGVPGKLKTLTDRLSATWAAKLDALRTGLTDARMGYLDKLNVASLPSGSDYTSARAGYLDKIASDPSRDPAISLVGSGSLGVSSGFGMAGVDAFSTQSTTYVNAVSVTGAGILEFAASGCGNQGYTASCKVIIDGVTVADQTSGSGAPYNIVCPVGIINSSGGTSLGSVPFKSSLVIQAKVSSSSSGATCFYKYHRTA